MASTDDLALLPAARYAALRRAIPGFEKGDFVSIVAALVWLDRQYGVDDDNNMIVVSEELSLFMPFWVGFFDPEIRFLLNLPGYSGNAELDRAVQERLHELLMRPVEVVFADPRREHVYPVIQGLRRIVATDPSLQGVGRGRYAYTAKLSGERVRIDG